MGTLAVKEGCAESAVDRCNCDWLGPVGLGPAGIGGMGLLWVHIRKGKKVGDRKNQTWKLCRRVQKGRGERSNCCDKVLDGTSLFNNSFSLLTTSIYSRCTCFALTVSLLYMELDI